jgi:hypothetical protein
MGVDPWKYVYSEVTLFVKKLYLHIFSILLRFETAQTDISKQTYFLNFFLIVVYKKINYKSLNGFVGE